MQLEGLVKSGAFGATISGNGPAIAAITKKKYVTKIKKQFLSLDGTTIIANINNKKAQVHEM